MIAQHKPTILGALIGSVLVTVAILARTAWGAPAAPPGEPSTLTTLADVIGPAGVAAIGGMACLAVAWLLGRARARKGWLRRGMAGNAAATVYGALTSFGAVLAVGGSVGMALAAVGGAMVAGMGLARDPETVQMPRVAAGEIES